MGDNLLLVAAFDLYNIFVEKLGSREKANICFYRFFHDIRG